MLVSMTNPDRQRHVFATFLGMPPDSDTPPVCGAVLTSAYDGRNAPDCHACARILRAHRVAPQQTGENHATKVR